LANYQLVLERVTFDSGSNPTDFGSAPTRVVTWVVDDGASSNDLSATQTTTIQITAVNDPPTLSNVAPTAHYTEEGAAATWANAVRVPAPDSLSLAGATVSIAAGIFANDGDVLAATTANTSITASYDSTAETLTLSGNDTLAHYRQVLDTVRFSAGENPTNF